VSTRDYPTTGLTIHWDSDICIHSGVCARTLPQVFRPREKPWVEADAADADAIAGAVDRCPSGALRYTRTAVEIAPPGALLLPPPAPEASEDEDDAEAEAADEPTVTVTATANGPYAVRGPARVYAADGTVLREVTRVALLCRCGHSGTKPFCDGSHQRVGFTDDQTPGA
jgi:uncharacterized Fe-S cluster protein YjdI/CDGSH-type Zn-finger protein